VPDPTWLEDVARLIADGIDRLAEAPPLSRFLFQEPLSYTLPALEQLRLPGVAEAMAAMATTLAAAELPQVSADSLKPLVDQVAKART